MLLTDIKYGYYQTFSAGDGSMYDYCTGYQNSDKNYTLFSEDSDFYYDLLDNQKYPKKTTYGQVVITIECELLDLLPISIDTNRTYEINELLSILPRIIVKLIVNNSNTIKLS